MQAAMKAGHEAMMNAEAEKKAQRIKEIEEQQPTLPTFEEEDAEKIKSRATISETDAANNNKKQEDVMSEDNVKAPTEANNVNSEIDKKSKEIISEDFDLDVEEAKKKEEQEKAKAEDESTTSDDPNVAKYLARDNVDRKSKNIHDLGQCKFVLRGYFVFSLLLTNPAIVKFILSKKISTEEHRFFQVTNQERVDPRFCHSRMNRLGGHPICLRQALVCSK
jgi:hypothetical protein